MSRLQCFMENFSNLSPRNYIDDAIINGHLDMIKYIFDLDTINLEEIGETAMN